LAYTTGLAVTTGLGDCPTCDMGIRPRFTDFHKNWYGCRGSWRNHSLQFWGSIFSGVSDLQGFEISIFPVDLLVIVTTVLTLPRSLWLNSPTKGHAHTPLQTSTHT